MEAPSRLTGKKRSMEAMIATLETGYESEQADDNALVWAVRADREDEIMALLEQGANPNVWCEGKPLLTWAIDNPNILRILIKYGALINIKSNDEVTPLIVAIEKDLLESVKILLAHGAHANILTGDEPLGLAITKGNIEIARELLAKGASPRGTLGYGLRISSLDYALKWGEKKEIAWLLLQYGAEFNSSSHLLMQDTFLWAILNKDYDSVLAAVIKSDLSHDLLYKGLFLAIAQKSSEDIIDFLLIKMILQSPHSIKGIEQFTCLLLERTNVSHNDQVQYCKTLEKINQLRLQSQKINEAFVAGSYISLLPVELIMPLSLYILNGFQKAATIS